MDVVQETPQQIRSRRLAAGMTAVTIADRVRAARAAMGASTTTFAARFRRSPRTIEDWEQGRRCPDPLALAILERIEKRVRYRAARDRRLAIPLDQRHRAQAPSAPTLTAAYPSRRRATITEYEVEPGRWVTRQRLHQLRKAGKLLPRQPLSPSASY